MINLWINNLMKNKMLRNIQVILLALIYQLIKITLRKLYL